MTPPTPFLFQPAFTPSEPTTLRAGDSWAWSRYFDGFPSGAGWMVQYVLNSPAASFPFPSGSITPSIDQYSFDVSVAAIDTVALPAGKYELYAILLNAAASSQQTFLLQNVLVAPLILGAAGGVDTRSFVKKTLDIIEAAIAGDTSPHVQEYEINGRRLQYTDRMKLFDLRAQYRSEYRQEQIASGEYTPKRRVGVYFRPNY